MMNERMMNEMVEMMAKYMADNGEDMAVKVVKGTRKPTNRAERRKATAHAKNRRKALAKNINNGKNAYVYINPKGKVFDLGEKDYGKKYHSHKDRRFGKNIEKYYEDEDQLITPIYEVYDDLIDDDYEEWYSCGIGEDDVDDNGWVRLDYYNDMVDKMRYWREEAMFYADKMNEMRDEVLKMRQFLMDKGLLGEYFDK